MTRRIWPSSLPRPLRVLLAAPASLYLFVLDLVTAWRVRRARDAPMAHGIKLLALPTSNEALYAERLQGALDLLAERAPRSLHQLQRRVGAVVLLPRYIRPRHRYWRRAGVVMLDQVIVWHWSTEALAVELAGWAADARLQAAGFGAERFRDRREHRVLLEKIAVGGAVLGMKEAAAALGAQAKREQAGEGRSPTAT